MQVFCIVQENESVLFLEAILKLFKVTQHLLYVALSCPKCLDSSRHKQKVYVDLDETAANLSLKDAGLSACLHFY